MEIVTENEAESGVPSLSGAVTVMVRGPAVKVDVFKE
jgi:hypothetical protein